MNWSRNCALKTSKWSSTPPPKSPEDLQSSLIRRFRLGADISFRKSLIRHFASKPRDAQRLILVFDDAEQFTPATLIALHALCERNSSLAVSLLLCGDKSFNALLNQPDLATLQADISLTYVLNPLDDDALSKFCSAYLQFRGKGRVLLSMDYLGFLIEQTRGLPEPLLNHLDLALQDPQFLAMHTRREPPPVDTAQVAPPDNPPAVTEPVATPPVVEATAAVGPVVEATAAVEPAVDEPAASQPLVATAPGEPIVPVAAGPVTTPVTPAVTAPQSAAAIPAAGGELEQVVQNWATAWRMQDTQSYLGYYHTGFAPLYHPSRSVWRADRINSVNRPARIELAIRHLPLLRQLPARHQQLRHPRSPPCRR